MSAESFAEASAAVENTLYSLAAIEKLATRGLHAQALADFERTRRKLSPHLQAIYDLEDQLAAVADAPAIVPRAEPPGGVYFASAHRAAIQLPFWCELALKRHNQGAADEWEVPGDLLSRYGVNVSQLVAGIQRERARLLSQNKTHEGVWTEAKSPQAWCKELGISERTWSRWTAPNGTVVVDRSISNKMVRIRKDTLPNEPAKRAAK